MADAISAAPIIITHTHKCGGTSLRHALISALGPAAVQLDYVPGSVNNPASLYHMDRARYWTEIERGPALPVVIGHFNIGKWSHIQPAVRVALMRHPIDRLISHYFFWNNCPAKPQNPLWVDLVTNKRSLLWFANQSTIRFMYSDGFFWNVDLALFDLIIVFARLGAGVKRLADMMQKPIELRHVNPTSSKAADYVAQRASMTEDKALMRQLRSLLSADINLYETALQAPSAA